MLERRLQMFRSKEQRDEKIPEVSISSLRRRVQEVDPYIRDTLRYGAFYAKISGAIRFMETIRIELCKD
jgi:hypothetical protein